MTSLPADETRSATARTSHTPRSIHAEQQVVSRFVSSCDYDINAVRFVRFFLLMRRAGYAVEIIDPLCFLTGCCRRRLKRLCLSSLLAWIF